MGVDAGTFQFASDIKSRWSGKNTDSKYSANGAAWEVFHSQFQVKAPWTSYGTNWQRVMADNDDGKGMYAYSLASAPQGSYTIELLNVLISNYSAPGTICGTIGCHSDCPSMCLSDFSSLSTYNGYYGAYSASPAARDFVFDSTPPKVSAGCRSGKCSGALYSKKSMEFEFSCTDTNAPCTFYCAIDGKPTTDPSAASSLGKGYKQCTSPVAVHAKASGSSTFTVYAVDAAGNVGDLSNPFTFYTDNTAPTVHFAGVAKRCLVDENYFIPDFTSTGPASTTANILSTANFVSTVGGICIPTTGTFGDTTVSATTPDTKITGTYGSTTCTCGTYQIYTDSTTSYLTYNQGTFPSLMDADSDSSLNAYLGYYPKSVPDKGLVAVSGKLTGKQYLVDGVTEIQDSDGSFDLSTGNGGSQSNGYMLYDVGTVTNTTDDISMTSYMYDTVIQVNLDITREVYNLEDGYYGAVLATKKVNDDYYYHVLHATNSPAAKVNMVCQHPEIKNCIQSSSNPFQMDCGLMIT